MSEITGFIAIILFLFSAAFIIASICLPFIVMAMDSRIKRIENLLACMEHMMRHGK